MYSKFQQFRSPSKSPVQLLRETWTQDKLLVIGRPGLTFDRDTGKCTTPGTVKMEGELKGPAPLSDRPRMVTGKTH